MLHDEMVQSDIILVAYTNTILLDGFCWKRKRVSAILLFGKLMEIGFLLPIFASESNNTF